MEKKNVVFLTVLAIATLLTAVVGTTFAYFTATVSGNDNAQATTVTTAQDLGVTYSEGGAAITLSNAVPGVYSTTAKTITVHNDSAATSLQYNIMWKDVVNNFAQGTGNTDDLVYSLVKVDNENSVNAITDSNVLANTAAYDATALGAMVSGKAYSAANHSATIDGGTSTITVGKVPANGSTNTVLVGGTLAGGATDTYELRIYYLETGLDQNTNQSTAGTSGKCSVATALTADDCNTAGGQWTAGIPAKTVSFSAKLETVLVNEARVTYTPAP